MLATLKVIAAASSARHPTTTDLRAPGAELVRQSPHRPADCPHIVSITLARRTGLILLEPSPQPSLPYRKP